MLYLMFILVALNVVSGANILGIFTIQSYSHFAVYKPLLEELSRRGHNVDVVGHFPRDSPLPRYNDLSIKGRFPWVDGTIDINDINIEQSVFEVVGMIFQMHGVTECEASLNSTVIRNLTETTKKYDLMITEIFFMDCMLGFTHLFDIPSIAFITSVNLPWASDRIGLPDNPSYVPNYFLGYTWEMNALERLHNAAVLYLTKLWYNFYAVELLDKIARNFFGSTMPHLRDLANNVSLILSNTHFSMQQSRPITSNFIEVGGIHIVENATMSKEFQQVLKTELKGVIYVSFGSLLKVQSFPEQKLRILFEALGNLPYKILWKGDRSKLSTNLVVPNNIQFEPWMPQLAILCDPSVKLYISHDGLLGSQEAIYCGIPVLGIPLWVDQLLNSKTLVNLGVSLEVPFSELSKEAVLEAAQELLENPKFKSNAGVASKIFRDRPMSALETAVYWTEYVINHGGSSHLRSKSADLPWYTYTCLDLLLIPAILCFICYLLFRLLTKTKKNVNDTIKNKFD